jgi:uncharacterized iron-regulated protein
MDWRLPRQNGRARPGLRYNGFVPHFIRWIASARQCALVLIAAAAIAAAPALAQNTCAPAGEWTMPGGGRIAAQEILSRAARESVVLLGENHDNADHHRWQLNTIAGLAALHPRLVLGFEMFPRRVQGVLDRWVAGELGEEEFLKASDWSRVWGNDAGFYLPLFHFARLNRMPMVALNVERELVREVGAKGLAAVQADKREGVSDPAPATENYVERLFAAYAEHPEKGRTAARSDPEFGRFVEAQLVWDRAMAQALAEAAVRNPGALVIGVMGSAHIAQGYGVPHQLQSLGTTRIASLLPWGPEAGCEKFSPGLATAVFGVPAARAAPPRPLLGITVDAAPDGVKVTAVRAGSIAETAGLKAGDVLLEVAGSAVKAPGDVRAIVGAMAPGTWLPLKAKREGDTVDLTAKFPPAAK